MNDHDAIYEAIISLSAVCDGAMSRDFQGFNGTDAKFGNRIAAAPRSEWTPEVYEEAAHILLKYRQQVLASTGIDVAKIPMVMAAQDFSTNYAARDQARVMGKRTKAKTNRVVNVVNGDLVVQWGKDPDFDALLKGVQALPGRRWIASIKANKVDVSDALEMFIDNFDFNVSDPARAILEKPRVAVAVTPDVMLHTDGRIVLTPFSWDSLEDVRALPGRDFDPPGFRDVYGTKVNVVNASPQVLVVAGKWGWTVSDDARRACEAAAARAQARNVEAVAAGDKAMIMADVSHIGAPDQLPPVFLNMLEEVLNRDAR